MTISQQMQSLMSKAETVLGRHNLYDLITTIIAEPDVAKEYVTNMAHSDAVDRTKKQLARTTESQDKDNAIKDAVSRSPTEKVWTRYVLENHSASIYTRVVEAFDAGVLKQSFTLRDVMGSVLGLADPVSRDYETLRRLLRDPFPYGGSKKHCVICGHEYVQSGDPGSTTDEAIPLYTILTSGQHDYIIEALKVLCATNWIGEFATTRQILDNLGHQYPNFPDTRSIANFLNDHTKATKTSSGIEVGLYMGYRIERRKNPGEKHGYSYRVTRGSRLF